MKKDSKIFLSGHKGLVGSAILRELKKEGYRNICTLNRKELDLINQKQVQDWFLRQKPEYVISAAAKVAGIIGNQKYKAEMLYDNLMIQSNLIDAAYRNGCQKFLFLGSSCIYPKEPDLPIKESCLMTGKLESTNDSYAIAKIAGIYLCKSYLNQYEFDTISVMPCNLYGENDNYDSETSHVIPDLIRKFHQAKIKREAEIWLLGDGSPMREFLYVDDLAKACIHLMNTRTEEEIINVGSGKEISIKQLAELIAGIVGYEGEIKWDTSKPNGTMRKVMDSSHINKTSWSPSITLKEGINKAYEDYKLRIMSK